MRVQFHKDNIVCPTFHLRLFPFFTIIVPTKKTNTGQSITTSTLGEAGKRATYRVRCRHLMYTRRTFLAFITSATNDACRFDIDNLHSSRRSGIPSCWITVVKVPSVQPTTVRPYLHQFRRALKTYLFG